MGRPVRRPWRGVAAAIGLIITSLGALQAASDSTLAKIGEASQKIDDWESELRDLDQNGVRPNVETMGQLDYAAETLLPKLESLAAKSNRNASEQAQLEVVAKRLNDILGVEAVTFDALTGAVSFNTDEINRNIQAMRDRAQTEATYEKIVELEKDAIEQNDLRLELADQILQKEKEILEYQPGGSRAMYADYRDAIQSDIDELNRQIDDLDKLANEREKVYNRLSEQHTQAYTPRTTGGGYENVPQKGSYEQEKKDLDYRRSIDLVSEAEYLEELKRMKKAYFSDVSDMGEDYSEDLRELNREIYAAEKSLNSARLSSAKATAKEQAAAAKEAYQEQVNLAKQAKNIIAQQLKDQYDEDVKAVERALAKKEKAINAEITAIDKAIEARKRLKQEAEYDTQINSIQAQLQYGKLDDFTRRELEAELKRIQEEQADYKWELEQQDRKEELQEELTAARELAQQRKQELAEELEIHQRALEEEYELHLAQLDAVFNNSSEQMAKISNDFVDVINNGISDAISKLQSAIRQAESAASRAERSSRSNTYNDNSTRSSTVNMYGSDYTPKQLERAVNKYLYE